MRSARADRPAPLLLLGAVRGLESEGASVESSLSAFRPDQILLGLSPEEVDALTEHFLAEGSEPWVPLAQAESAYARGLSTFGPVRLPSPSFVAAIRFAHAQELPLSGVEPSDDSYSALFVEHLGYLDLLRRTLGERSLVNAPPDADSPEAFAEAWEERSQKGAGSKRLAAARTRHVSEELRRIRGAPRNATSPSASLKNRSALVVDVERFRPIRHELVDAGWEPLLEERPDPGPVRPLSASGAPSPRP